MENKTKKVYTLILIYSHPKILLGMKKRGHGKDKWNGFGGKVEKGESVEDGALRELREEAGIVGKEIKKRGVVEFEFENNPEIMEVHYFHTDKFDGEPIESEEMFPQWFHVDEIPFKDMWQDDMYWMPYFLQGKNFKGKFLYTNSGDKIIKWNIEEILG